MSAALTPAEIRARREQDAITEAQFAKWRSEHGIMARGTAPMPLALKPIRNYEDVVGAVKKAQANNNPQEMVEYISQRAQAIGPGAAARLPPDWPKRYREPIQGFDLSHGLTSPPPGW